MNLSRATQQPGDYKPSDWSPLTLPAALRQSRLISGTLADQTLTATLDRTALKSGTPLQGIAIAAGHHDAFVRTRTPLALPSPKIQRAILDGTQPVDVTLDRLVRQTLALDGRDQGRL